MPKAPKKSVTDPFKPRKTREAPSKSADTISPPADIAKAVDSFREFQEQAKHFEGEAQVQKDLVLDYGTEQYVKRALKGTKGSFKILGEESMVNFVVMDTSAGLTEEEVDAFRERWGDKAADDLITRDLGSIRFDAATFEANYDEIVKVLQGLPKDVLDNLFKTMLMKAKSGAVEKAMKYAKTPEELRELISQLKIRLYIR